MDYIERLRRLAINDARIADAHGDCLGGGELDPKTLAMIRLAALVAVGGAVPSYGAQADAAVSAGATAAEIVDVLIGVVPIVGLPLVSRRPEAGLGARLRHRRHRTPIRRVTPAYPPRRPVAVACCTASSRDETPSFR